MPKIEIETMPTSWRGELQEGHCFVWSMPKVKAMLYSRVLETPRLVEEGGYWLTLTHGGPFPPAGCVCYVKKDNVTMLLSKEQMDLASRLGWPQAEEALSTVLSVPSN